MDATGKSLAVRVVMLSPEPPTALPLSWRGGPALVWAASAYEAAAELLAAPTAGLVIDLRAMNLRHLRLIQIARQMDVKLLAFGHLPPGMGSEELSGVCLVSRQDLPDALRRIAQEEQAGPAVLPEAGTLPAPAAGIPVSPAAERPKAPPKVQEPAGAPAARLSPAKSRPGEPADRRSGAPVAPSGKEFVAEPAQAVTGDVVPDASPQPPQDRGAAPSKPGAAALPPMTSVKTLGGLLSPEELAALLEDEP
jgi:hypothetical protein